MTQAISDEHMTLARFCTLADVPAEQVMELIQHGIVQPLPSSTSTIIYLDQDQLLRCLKARRLQHDLELNLPGVALVLDLLDREHNLTRRLNCLEQMLQRLTY